MQVDNSFCQIYCADDCTHFNISDEAKNSNEDFAPLLRVKINELRGPDAKTRPWTKIDLKKRGMTLPKYGYTRIFLAYISQIFTKYKNQEQS